VAALGLGSAGIPELQRIFNAKGRAEVYKDAAQMIRRSILEYRSHNPDPDETTLTPNGIILVQRTYGAIDMVDAVLAGQMPSQMEMLEITEAMTRAGTVKHVKGETPVNRISANPSRVADAEALAAANEAARNERKAFAFAADARQERQVADDEIKQLRVKLIEQQELQSAGVAFQDNLLAMEPLSDGKSRLQRAATEAGLANKFNFAGDYTTISNAMIDYVHTGANPLKSRIKLTEEIHKQAHP
jgi:hypothetical protein